MHSTYLGCVRFSCRLAKVSNDYATFCIIRLTPSSLSERQIVNSQVHKVYGHGRCTLKTSLRHDNNSLPLTLHVLGSLLLKPKRVSTKRNRRWIGSGTGSAWSMSNQRCVRKACRLVCAASRQHHEKDTPRRKRSILGTNTAPFVLLTSRECCVMDIRSMELRRLCLPLRVA